jgi:thiamine kinase-like enzyme
MAETSVQPEPTEVLAQVDAWRDRQVEIKVLKGGLSHQTYLAEADGERVVVRILNPEIERYLLGVPARLEVANTVAAAASGVAPRVIAAFPEIPALVIEYIEGRTLDVQSVREPETTVRIGRACRRLHEGSQPFANPFSIFRQLDGFLGLCRRHDLRIPDGYESYIPTVQRIEEALSLEASPPAPCNNDLLAENILDDGENIRLIDFQLSGMNDPSFELGDVAAESDFTPDDTERLCEGYFEGRDPMQVARARLYQIMSNFTWTLWFSVHNGLVEPNPDVEFDYWEEALDKWSQAVDALEAPEFGALLDRVRTAS